MAAATLSAVVADVSSVSLSATPCITKGEDFLCFTVKDHSLKVLQNLRTLQQNSRFCDVTIKVDLQRFPAHRALLSATSPYFQAMFAGGLLEGSEENIELHSISSETFESLLDFIYTGKIQVNRDNVQDVLTAADMLQLTDVVTACTAFFKQEFQPDNCIGIYRLAEAHLCQDLVDAALNYIHINFVEVSQTDEFYELPLELLKSLLSSENLRVDSEFQVFEAGARWILHDLSRRRQNVYELLDCIRMLLISHRELDAYVSSVKDVGLKVALAKLLRDLRMETRLVALETAAAANKALPRKWAQKSLYVVGGFKRDYGQRWSDGRTLAVVNRYNTYEQTWHRVTTLKEPLSGHGVVISGELIFVMGGENQGLLFDHVEVYSIIADCWMSLPSLLMPRCQMGSCTLDGYVFVLGGCVASAVTDTVERYDPITRNWTQMDRMTRGRYAMGVVAHDGLIYVVGGKCYLSGDLDVVESFNPVNGRWTALASLNTRRSYVGVTIHDGYLYAVGGSCDSKELPSVERYSFEKNYWETVAPLLVGRAGSCVASIGGKLYVVGGHTSAELSPSVTLKSMECYDSESNTWKNGVDMPVGCSEAGVVVF